MQYVYMADNFNKIIYGDKNKEIETKSLPYAFPISSMLDIEGGIAKSKQTTNVESGPYTEHSC